MCYNVTWVNGLVLIVNNDRIYGRTPPLGNLNSCKLACIMAEKSEASCQTSSARTTFGFWDSVDFTWILRFPTHQIVDSALRNT